MSPFLVPFSGPTEHNRSITLRAVVWSLTGGPAITGPVAVEQLESDLDTYIDEFIMSYRLGNPPKK
jgi:hypothetical protein